MNNGEAQMTATDTVAVSASSHGEPDGNDLQVTGFKAWAKENGVDVPVVLPGMPGPWFAARYPEQ